MQKCSNATQDIFSSCSVAWWQKWRWKTWELWAIIACLGANCFYFDKVQIQSKTILENAMGLLTEYQHLNAAQCQTLSFFLYLSIGSLMYFFLGLILLALLLLRGLPVYFFSWLPGPSCIPFLWFINIFSLSYLKIKKKKKIYWSKNILSEWVNKIYDLFGSRGKEGSRIE